MPGTFSNEINTKITKLPMTKVTKFTFKNSLVYFSFYTLCTLCLGVTKRDRLQDKNSHGAKVPGLFFSRKMCPALFAATAFTAWTHKINRINI